MSDSIQFKTILYEVADGRARITLNRPEKRNALSEELLKELHDALWAADEDVRVHGVILRGSGKDFCAGYDMTQYESAAITATEFQRGRARFDDDAWRLERTQRLRMAIFDMHKPVVAQVHGRCLAGGADVALLCDMIICSTDAQIGFPPARSQGSLPNHMWTYLVGPQWAKRLLLTGDSILGRDAATIGLVLKAVEPEQLTAEVEGLVDRLASIDTDLLSANKRIVNLAIELMGGRTMQRLAAEMDARGHLAQSREVFRKNAMEKGLKEAVRLRDEPFGDGLIKF